MKRHIHCWLFGTAAVIAMMSLGCAESPPADQQAANDGVAPAPPPPPAPAPPAPAEQPADNTPAEGPTDGNTTDNTPAEEQNTESSPARVGFGAKGHYDSNDYVSVVVSSQFRIEERITLLNIKRGMDGFRALHSRYPKDGEEFFKEVIDENGISLPDLPAGQIYGYNPDDPAEPLLILKPKES